MKAWSRTLSLLALATAATACGVHVGNPDNSSSKAKPESGDSAEYEGAATMGPVNAARVLIYAVDAAGTRGELLGETVTDETGAFKFKVQSGQDIEVAVVGGTYTDEATGEPVALEADDELSALSGDLSGHSLLAVNALTDMATTRARGIASGDARADLVLALEEVAEIFGVDDIDFAHLRPQDLTALAQALDSDAPAAKLGLIMSGLSQIAADKGLPPRKLGAMVKDLSRDFGDGAFDGKRGDHPLEPRSGLAPADAMDAAPGAFDNFANGPRNRAGFPPAKRPKPPETRRDRPPAPGRQAPPPPQGGGGGDAPAGGGGQPPGGGGGNGAPPGEGAPGDPPPGGGGGGPPPP